MVDSLRNNHLAGQLISKRLTVILDDTVLSHKAPLGKSNKTLEEVVTCFLYCK